jgi:hypothetical protein
LGSTLARQPAVVAYLFAAQAFCLDGAGAAHYSGARSAKPRRGRGRAGPGASQGGRMRDRNLERNIQRIESLVERWKQLSVFLDRGFKGEGFSGDEEAAFLDLKSAIAQEHEMLMTTLGSQAERDDKALRLLNSVPSLQAFKELPEGMARKIASEWHSTFISMQALLGRLKGRRAQLAGISSLRVGLRNVFGHPLVLIMVAAAAMYGVYRLADELVPKLKQIWETDR